MKEYGLAEPRIDVAFKAAGDKDYRHLLIGEKSPTGADLFAKRGDDKRVFLIPASQETTFNRGTFDLRDKTLLRFERDKVDGIDITAGGKPLTLTKEGGDWKITKPLQGARRLRHGRRIGVPPAGAADEVDGRGRGERRGSEKIWLRQA